LEKGKDNIVTTTKKSVAYRISKQAENHLNRIVKLTGMTKTAAVELAIAKLSLSLSLGGNMDNRQANIITNARGKEIDFDAALNLMDDDLRERLTNEREWDSDRQFFLAYCVAHEKAFSEEFEPSKQNPVW
jgi:hypothetical protein